MPFATPHLRTLNEKGTQLPVRLVGVSENDKRFCTSQVTLCAQADQQDVKLEVIFRSRSGGANIDKTEQAFYKNHPEIKVRWQHKAWADEEVIFDYLMDFREQTMDKGEVVLFMDNHGSQRTPLVQLTMEALDIKPIFFPANCTDCVSPVDRNIGAWLKRKVYMYQEEELEDHEHWSLSVAEGGLTAPEKRMMVVKWLSRAWEEFKTTRMHTINSAWVDSGIMLAVDGTENHLIKLWPNAQHGSYTF